MPIYRFGDMKVDPQKYPWGERVEYALEFNGSNSRILIPNDAAINMTGDMTVEIWLKSYQADFGRPLSKRLNSSDAGWLVYWHSSTSSITWWYNVGICRDEDVNFPVLEKTHAGFAYDNQNNKLLYYLDADLKEEESSVSALSHNDGDFEIGGELETSSYYKGLIYQVRLWDKVLTQSEIQRNIDNYYISGRADNLVGYWPMNEGKGSIVYDHSGNGNHGTIENATWIKA